MSTHNGQLTAPEAGLSRALGRYVWSKTFSQTLIYTHPHSSSLIKTIVQGIKRKNVSIGGSPAEKRVRRVEESLRVSDEPGVLLRNRR